MQASEAEEERRAGGDERCMALSAWSLVHGLAMLALDGQLSEATPAAAEELTLAATDLMMFGMAASHRRRAAPTPHRRSIAPPPSATYRATTFSAFARRSRSSCCSDANRLRSASSTSM